MQAHLQNTITSIFQTLTSAQLCFIYHDYQECEHFALGHLSEEQVHESLSPIKQLFSIPCLFDLSCKELLENIYMLAQSFSIKHPVG